MAGGLSAVTGPTAGHGGGAVEGGGRGGGQVQHFRQPVLEDALPAAPRPPTPLWQVGLSHP